MTEKIHLEFNDEYGNSYYSCNRAVCNASRFGTPDTINCKNCLRFLEKVKKVKQ